MFRRRDCYRTGGVVGVLALLRSLFMLVCVLITTFFVVGYAVGWITIEKNDRKQTATIEIDTGEVKSTANQAVEEGRELLSEAGDKLRDIGNSSSPHTRPSKNEPAIQTEVIPGKANPHSTGEFSASTP